MSMELMKSTLESKADQSSKTLEFPSELPGSIDYDPDDRINISDISEVLEEYDPDYRVLIFETPEESPFEVKDYNPDDRVEVDIANKDIGSEIDYNIEVLESVDNDTNSSNESSEEKNEQTEFEVNGGSYSDVKRNSNGDTHEVHHMPADSASNLDRDDGPAIKMEKDDHRQTASCGNSREAREYRAAQKELIENGKFREALQMDIDDIHEKFGSKYDEAIAEMLAYVDKLELEGKI